MKKNKQNHLFYTMMNRSLYLQENEEPTEEEAE